MSSLSLPPPDTEPKLRTGEVARILHVSVDRVRQWSRSGRLPCQHTPLGRLYDPATVAAFQAQRSTGNETIKGTIND